MWDVTINDKSLVRAGKGTVRTPWYDSSASGALRTLFKKFHFLRNSVVSTLNFHNRYLKQRRFDASNVRATPLPAPKESSKSTAKRPLAKPVWLIRKRTKIRYFFSSFSQEANRCFIITVTSIFYPNPEIQFSFFAFSGTKQIINPNPNPHSDFISSCSQQPK